MNPNENLQKRGETFVKKKMQGMYIPDFTNPSDVTYFFLRTKPNKIKRVMNYIYDRNSNNLKISCDYTSLQYLMEGILRLKSEDFREKGLKDKVFVLLRKGETEEALRFCREILATIDRPTTDIVLAYVAEVYHLLDQYELANRFGQQALLAARNRRTANYFEARNIQAHIQVHRNMNDALKELESLSKSRITDERVKADVLFTAGEAFLISGHYAAGYEKCLEALDFSESIGYKKGKADSLRRIAEYYAAEANSDEAERAVKKALPLYEDMEEIGLVWIQGTYAEILAMQRKWEKAEKLFKKSAEMAGDILNQNRIAHSLVGQAAVLRMSGTPQIRLCNDAIGIYKNIKSDWGLVHAHIERALGHLALKQNGKFSSDLLRAVNIAQRSKQAPFVRELDLATSLHNTRNPFTFHPLIFA